jgi:hypothetical protein
VRRRPVSVLVAPVLASPVTAGYLAVLLGVYGITHHLLSADQWAAVLRSASTNVTNLEHHPVLSLAGSAVLIATPLFSQDTLLTVGLGIAGCMGWIERRRGGRVAAGTFLAGHVGATMLTLPVILAGIAAGRYPAELRDALDIGISYGSIAMTAAIVRELPRWLAPLWAAGGVAYLLSEADWFGPLPDFTTVGHLFAVAIGLTAAALPALRRSLAGRRRRTAQPAHPGPAQPD